MDEIKTKISVFSMLTGILALFLFAVFTPTVSAPTEPAKSSPEPKVLGAETSTEIPLPNFTELKPQQFVLKKIVDTTSVSARSFFVFDLGTGQILVEKESDTKTSIASLTKLMTALLAYEYLALDEQIIVTPKDSLTITPSLRLRIGESVKVNDVINAMLVGSANDAAIFLGRVVADKTGIPIADLMNQKAGALGMQNTRFENPIGFDSSKQFSTAYDVHILVKAILRHQNFSELGRLSQYSFSGSFGNTYRVRATNKLIQKDSAITGIKTGYTEGAQGAMVTKFDHQGHEIAVIVLGSDYRDSDTTRLKTIVQESYSLETTEPLK